MWDALQETISILQIAQGIALEKIVITGDFNAHVQSAQAGSIPKHLRLQYW